MRVSPAAPLVMWGSLLVGCSGEVERPAPDEPAPDEPALEEPALTPEEVRLEKLVEHARQQGRVEESGGVTVIRMDSWADVGNLTLGREPLELPRFFPGDADARRAFVVEVGRQIGHVLSDLLFPPPRLPEFLPAAPEDPTPFPETALNLKIVCDDPGTTELVQTARPRLEVTGRRIHWEIADQRFDSLDELRAGLARIYQTASAEERFIWLDVDGGVSYGNVADTLIAAEDAGFTRVRLRPPG